MKYQVVGNLTLKYEHGNGGDVFVEGVIANLNQTKQKVLSPQNTEKVDESGKIRVKLSGDEKNGGHTKSVLVMKYVWNSKEDEQSLPFSLRMEVDQQTVDGDQHQVTASCTVARNHSDGVMKELSITGIFNEGMAQCLEHSQMENIDFLWSQDVPEKFMWSFKKHRVEEECKLTATFGCNSEEPKVLKMKMQFEIEDCGISNVRMNMDPDGEAQIVRTVRSIRSGEVMLK